MTFWDVFTSFPVFIVLVIIAVVLMISLGPKRSSKSPRR